MVVVSRAGGSEGMVSSAGWFRKGGLLVLFGHRDGKRVVDSRGRFQCGRSGMSPIGGAPPHLIVRRSCFRPFGLVRLSHDLTN